MKISNWMRKDAPVCRLEDTLDNAAAQMLGEDCGAMPAVDAEGKVAGMITDRDICMCGLIEGKPLGQLPVSLAMSKELWTCLPDDSLALARETMKTHRVTRLPVVDGEQKLLGLLRLGDLAMAEGKSSTKHAEFVELVQTLKTRDPAKAGKTKTV